VAAVSFSRQDILQIVALLIRNAAPCSDPRIRRKRETCSLVLWTAVFQMIRAWFGGPALEDSIRRWPMALRRRFKYMELARVYDLSVVNQRHFRHFQI
jgi:hypothetical protein